MGYQKPKTKTALTRTYTTLRCPMVGHQASWCRHLCEPMDGFGLCGRPATHHMKSKWQEAIADYLDRQGRENCDLN